MNYCVGDVVKVNDGVFVDLLGVVKDTKDMTEGCYVKLIGEEDSMYFELSEVKPVNPRECFVASVKDAILKETPYMFMLIGIEGYVDYELIIEPLVNFEDKLEYVLKTYDEQLNHKYSQGIEIVGFGVSESLKEIEEVVYGEDESSENESQEPQEESTTPIFKVGDRIKVIKAIPDEGEKLLPSGVVDLIGKIGVIKDIDENTSNPYPIYVGFEEHEIFPLRQGEIELYDGFEVGDKVLIDSSSRGEYNGMIGEVVELNCVGVLHDNIVEINGKISSFNNNELKLLTQINEKEFNKLLEGTKVYVEYNTEGWFIKVENGIETITFKKELRDKNGAKIGNPIGCITRGEIKVYRF